MEQACKRRKKILKAVLIGPIYGTFSAFFMIILLAYAIEFILKNGDEISFDIGLLVRVPVMAIMVAAFCIPFTALFGIPTLMFMEKRHFNRPWQYFLIGGLIGGLFGASVCLTLSASLPYLYLIGILMGAPLASFIAYFSARIYFKP